VSGSRHEATERVTLSGPGFQTEGWTLNISRGGARLVLEEPVDPEAILNLVLGHEGEAMTVRVVWVQDESDGQIVGVQYVGVDGSIPPPEPRSAPDSTSRRK
jgi:hypothetical protein